MTVGVIVNRVELLARKAPLWVGTHVIIYRSSGVALVEGKKLEMA